MAVCSQPPLPARSPCVGQSPMYRLPIAPTGWAFEVKTQPGQAIDLTALMATFAQAALPNVISDDQLPSVQIHNLVVAYNSANGDYTFGFNMTGNCHNRQLSVYTKRKFSSPR